MNSLNSAPPSSWSYRNSSKNQQICELMWGLVIIILLFALKSMMNQWLINQCKVFWPVLTLLPTVFLAFHDSLHKYCEWMSTFNSLFDLIPMVVCLQNTLSIEQLGISISKFIALSASSLMHPIYSYCMWANRITWKVGRHIVREWSPPSAFNPSVLVPNHCGTQLNEYAAVCRVVLILNSPESLCYARFRCALGHSLVTGVRVLCVQSATL